MKEIAVLGSTGSIGVTTLDVVSRFEERFKVVALAAGRNVDLLAQQIKRFRPQLVSVSTEEAARELRSRLGSSKPEICVGIEGAIAVATYPTAKLVVCAMVGVLGLRPTYAAVEAGKDIAFANKEVLVVAGELIIDAVRRRGTRLLPVDSEHNAIFQCLHGQRREHINRIILTASGGPFRTLPREQFSSITVADTLKHPTWRMGKKVTVDSATLMNKGLEVIEARWLFDVEPQRISVVVHPQSVVHSMVTFDDSSTKAQMGLPNMRLPLQYAMSHPARWSNALPRLDLASVGELHFGP